MRRATRTAIRLFLYLFLVGAALPIRAGQPGQVVDRAGATLRSADASGGEVDPKLPPASTNPPIAPVQKTAPSANGGTAGPPTIDSMNLQNDYPETYQPAVTISLLGGAATYTLSDGSTWTSGAGTYYTYGASLDHVEVSGNTIHYFLQQADGLLYQQTDYDNGDHSSQGTLGVSGALVLEATLGSTTAVLRGGAVILSNGYSNYADSRFNFFSPIVGPVVPYQLT